VKHVALLLHLYQPPTQDPDVLRRIDGECYAPLAEMLLDTGASVTLNINYSLTTQLASLRPSTLETLSKARGWELCTSGAFHPILPLVPAGETERQIRLNTEGNAAHLPGREVRGVFPPEMAWDPSLAGLLSGMGLSWAAADDIPWVHSGREAPWGWIPVDNGLSVILRSNFWSNRIAFHESEGGVTAARIVEGMRRWTGDSDAYLLIALDGETFGHHRRGGIERFLRPFVEGLDRIEGVRLSTISEIVSLFPLREASVPAGSWSTTPADLERGLPWPLWDDPSNADHMALRSLRDMVLAWARRCTGTGVAALADRMLYSCPFWWATPGRYDAVQARRGVGAMLEAAMAAHSETGDRKTMDRVLDAAGAVPSMHRRG